MRNFKSQNVVRGSASVTIEAEANFMLDEPKDFIGYLMSQLISRQLEDPKLESRVKGWKMTVVLATDYYPITLIFDRGVRFSKGAASDATLTVEMSFSTIIRLVMEETSTIKAFLKGEIKARGMFRHPVAMKRFYGLLNAALKG
jgi:putative sterol carrier protein